MSTSQTSSLFKVHGDEKISAGTLGYILARNRQRAFDLVIREFKKSGLSQAVLARRLGKAPEVISRLLARPRNWELDTFAELMFGVSGAMPSYATVYPPNAVAQAQPTSLPRTEGTATTKENDGPKVQTAWSSNSSDFHMMEPQLMAA